MFQQNSCDYFSGISLSLSLCQDCLGTLSKAIILVVVVVGGDVLLLFDVVYILYIIHFYIFIYYIYIIYYYILLYIHLFAITLS